MPNITEYVWIDGQGNLRSKSRVFDECDIDSLPKWNFDGSSTGQAESHDSEIILKPCKVFRDPLKDNLPRGYKAYLVLCECEDKNGAAVSSNARRNANIIFDKFQEHHPWFGLEQEYVLYKNETGRIVGWPDKNNPEPQGKYYCAIGADRCFLRDMVEEHYIKCLIAGIKICGINAEVLPGQWEFQIGPCEGIGAADDLWMARYILQRIGEKYNIRVSFDSKPVSGNWNGSGCHTNYSTQKTRSTLNGFTEIMSIIDKLKLKHKEHLLVYGDNTERLSGTHETSKLETFTFGIGDRTASVRIPSSVKNDGCGYIEDRRPAGNCDPYLVTSIIVETTCQ